ncbi:MAG: TrkH family potassium uptake protein [Solobacterium sp.]|nr:TrkH family potassium uptake protein [Solobacterium sp.]
MNFRMILRIIGYILFLEPVLMLPGAAIAWYDGEPAVVHAYLISMGIILAVGAVFTLIGRNARSGFYAREGLVTTGLSWLIMSALGCLPFYITRQIPSYVDCMFEMVSGFTTTGSSILSNVEGLSRGLLYWRSFSHWVGGMGVLVFLMAIVPLSGKNGGFTLHILRAESPGPSVGKMVPRMKKTALILYLIYTGLTVLDFLLLWIGGMSPFDAFCHAVGTAGTGGFGVKNDSLAGYSPYLQNVTTVFMFLFGVNFSCYYLLLLKRVKDVFHDEELRTYLLIIFASITVISFNIRGLYGSLGETVRHAAFQVGTVMSTTGFATTDFDLWPSLSKGILLILMLGGACAGSTGGGLKIARFLLMLKALRRNIHENLHPAEVRKVTVNGARMDEKVLTNLYGYLIAYVGIMIISFLIISMDGFSIETNISAVFATFNNIGPGFDAVGPTMNYSLFSPLSKCAMIFNMLAGRLEIMPMLVLFSRTTWRRK